MAFDEEIRTSLVDCLLDRTDTSTRCLFGCVACMVGGKMFAVPDECGAGMNMHTEQRSRALVLVSPFLPVW